MPETAVRRSGAIVDNKSLVMDLMTHSKFGGLGEVFITYAIQDYAKRTAAAEPASNGLFNGATWKSIAEDVAARMDEFYGRHG